MGNKDATVVCVQHGHVLLVLLSSCTPSQRLEPCAAILAHHFRGSPGLSAFRTPRPKSTIRTLLFLASHDRVSGDQADRMKRWLRYDCTYRPDKIPPPTPASLYTVPPSPRASIVYRGLPLDEAAVTDCLAPLGGNKGPAIFMQSLGAPELKMPGPSPPSTQARWPDVHLRPHERSPSAKAAHSSLGSVSSTSTKPFGCTAK